METVFNKDIPSKYRPIPFWSWNERLSVDETRRQAEEMHRAGMGGYFMHARGGLQTEYMGEEWFDNISAGIEVAKEKGMGAWAYDENGWPSGFGNGFVNGKGIEYQQKYLRHAKYCGERHENTIIIIDDEMYYYEVNPFYVDTLDGKVTNEFIKEVYEPYYQKYGNDLTGFFTDEPQVSRNGMPWSFILEDEYRKAYNDELVPHLAELFYEVNEYKTTRIRFWKLVTELFSKNYMKPIYDWCTERGLLFTGHLSCEETFCDQITANGVAMPHYEYFSIPGMDCLGRNIIYDLTPYQLGSAAAQLGKKQVLSESFGLCGHGVSFTELKGIYQHQMIHGINLLCQHLEGYSLRGIRKRDYPPALFYQQPWWNEYEAFCTAMSRTGMILAEGEIECDTLVIHPQTTAWTMYNDGDNKGIDEFYLAFKNTIYELDEKHIQFHLGDEILIERHGKVDSNKFIIGQMAYTTVLVPEGIELFENTRKLLEEFYSNGGIIMRPEEAKENTDIVDNPKILYTKRKYDGFDVYYFANHSKQKQTANISVGSTVIDISTGEEKPFGGRYEFDSYESLIVVDNGSVKTEISETNLSKINLSGEWQIEKCDYNALTLDICDYYFDNELIEKNGYVLDIQNKACELKRPVNIKQEYKVQIADIPSEMFLVCETPWIFDISVNGKPVEKQESYDYIIDTSFKKIDISKFIQTGENTITFVTTFKQSDEVYECIEKSKIFESERNKLTYDMEIEPCYLFGTFGVKLSGTCESAKKDSFRFSGNFVIDKMPQSICLQEIEKQGFPFFAGSMTVSRDFDIDNTNCELEFAPKGINAISVCTNDVQCGKTLWAPYRVDISRHINKGKNKIKLTLTNNLRNLMGPHHITEECYAVTPSTFFKKKRPGDWEAEKTTWFDGYCFTETTVF